METYCISGFKSNIQTFINRERFNYGIPALDKLLKLENATGETGESSYLIYDENILRCLKFAGIPGPEAYATIKNIKKKHKDKVLKVKEKFKTGFVKYLVETEHADENIANETTERAWKVIEDSASYLFCGSHAMAVGLDSAYGAYLKAHFPYEFYVTMLKLYTEKKNKEKVTLIIDEMARYRNIHLTPGRFGQDNRDWFVDKENKTISQSLSSIKFMNKTVTKELYEAGKIQFNTFTDVLFYLSRNTHVDTRQLKILIGIGYFSQFGKTGKLMKIFNEFTSGINKVSKTIKNYQPRLDNIKFIEETMEDVDIKVFERLCFENDNVGLCLSKEREKSGYYFVTEVDDKYGCKIKLYNVARGTVTPYIKINKKLFAIRPIKVNDLIFIKPQDINERQRYSYTDGERRKIEGAKDWWMDNYDIKERISNE